MLKHKLNKPFPPQVALVKVFITAIETLTEMFTKAENWKQFKCPSVGENDTKCISLPLNINLMMKSNEVMIILTQMNLENTVLSLNNQTHKTTHCISAII